MLNRLEGVILRVVAVPPYTVCGFAVFRRRVLPIGIRAVRDNFLNDEFPIESGRRWRVLW